MAKLIKVWDGSAWQDIATAVPNALTTDGVQTLTNKTISGSSNTITNIPNSALTNSSITINGSAVSLGGSVSLPGDIESVTASSPLTGGGTSGALTIGIQDASTSQKGAVQLTDSTSSTLTTTAATPNAVKSAYDLANGAIPKTLTTTTGDIIYASGANTPSRLGIGSTGQVLSVSGGVPAWSSPSSAMTLISSTASSSSVVNITNIPQTYKHLLAIVRGPSYGTSSLGISMSIGISSATGGSNYSYMALSGNSMVISQQTGDITIGGNGNSSQQAFGVEVWLPEYSVSRSQHGAFSYGWGGNGYQYVMSAGWKYGHLGAANTVTSLYFSASNAVYTVDLYGVS